MFVIRRMVNVHVRKAMTTELATGVKMSTMTIPIALTVNVSQPTQRTTLIFVTRKVANVLV
jgi:hypothetical protein